MTDTADAQTQFLRDATDHFTRPVGGGGFDASRVLEITSSATPAVNVDNYDVVNITAQAANITGFVLTGTPVDMQPLRVVLRTASGTHSVAWGASFSDSIVNSSLPASIGTTVSFVDLVWYSSVSSFVPVFSG